MLKRYIASEILITPVLNLNPVPSPLGCFGGLSLGFPYVRFFPDMSGILVAKYASGRNVKQCFIVRDFGIMHFMKSNRNVFTVRII